jgi:hypothetical protein
VATPNAQLVDDIREPLYDVFKAAAQSALTTQIQMFVTPKGPAKGIEETNMTKSGELPVPEEMQVYSVRVVFTDMAIADVIGFCKAYVLRLQISGHPKLTLPLRVEGNFSQGINDAKVQIDFPEDFKHQITAGTPFYVEFVSRTGYTLTDTAKGAHIRVELDGIHTVKVG